MLRRSKYNRRKRQRPTPLSRKVKFDEIDYTVLDNFNGKYRLDLSEENLLKNLGKIENSSYDVQIRNSRYNLALLLNLQTQLLVYEFEKIIYEYLTFSNNNEEGYDIFNELFDIEEKIEKVYEKSDSTDYNINKLIDSIKGLERKIDLLEKTQKDLNERIKNVEKISISIYENLSNVVNKNILNLIDGINELEDKINVRR